MKTSLIRVCNLGIWTQFDTCWLSTHKSKELLSIWFRNSCFESSSLFSAWHPVCLLLRNKNRLDKIFIALPWPFVHFICYIRISSCFVACVRKKCLFYCTAGITLSGCCKVFGNYKKKNLWYLVRFWLVGIVKNFSSTPFAATEKFVWQVKIQTFIHFSALFDHRS